MLLSLVVKLFFSSTYWAGRYYHLDTLNSRIHPLFQILDTEQEFYTNSRRAAGRIKAAKEGVQLY